MGRLRLLLIAAAALGTSSATLSGALTALTLQHSLPTAASLA
jgi:hypothetical protein